MFFERLRIYRHLIFYVAYSSIKVNRLTDLLGYYKYPKTCNFHIPGDCRYKVSWAKEPKPNEIRFDIEVKGANTTSFGFSPNKTFVRFVLITVFTFY